MTAKRWFKWTIEIQVDATWVADGVDFDNERAHDMLAEYINGAFNHELKAKVIQAPKKSEIMHAQGYSEKEIAPFKAKGN